MVLCHDASASLDDLFDLRAELEAAGISLPTIVAATKTVEAEPATVARLKAELGDFEVVFVSALDDESLERFREAVLRLTGLIRIYLRHDGEIDRDPVALRPSATIADVARAIHKDLERRCTGARVWGLSARFAGQRVGRMHQVADRDAVEILAG